MKRVIAVSMAVAMLSGCVKREHLKGPETTEQYSARLEKDKARREKNRADFVRNHKCVAEAHYPVSQHLDADKGALEGMSGFVSYECEGVSSIYVEDPQPVDLPKPLKDYAK